MVGLDEEALICDFAEVYHVYDWRSLPVKTAATLAMGLGPDSRIIKKMCGINVGINTTLLAMAVDALHVLVWQNTKDGAKGRNRPALITERLTGQEKPSEYVGFDTAEDFHAWRATIVGSDNNVG